MEDEGQGSGLDSSSEHLLEHTECGWLVEMWFRVKKAVLKEIATEQRRYAHGAAEE